MAKPGRKDIISRLADAGEEALQRVPDLPGATRLVDATNQMRERIDDLTKKVRGIDALEERIATLEKQLAEAQAKGGTKTKEVAKATSRSSSASSTTAASKKKRAAAPKKPSS
jgi:hypothetical protein